MLNDCLPAQAKRGTATRSFLPRAGFELGTRQRNPKPDYEAAALPLCYLTLRFAEHRQFLLLFRILNYTSILFKIWIKNQKAFYLSLEVGVNMSCSLSKISISKITILYFKIGDEIEYSTLVCFNWVWLWWLNGKRVRGNRKLGWIWCNLYKRSLQVMKWPLDPILLNISTKGRRDYWIEQYPQKMTPPSSS